MAVVSLDGEVLRVAFRPVRARIGLDGAATQDAVEWWTGLRAAREAIAGGGVDGAELHVVAITGRYGSSVPVGADGEPVGEVLLWADARARDLTRAVIGGPVTIGGSRRTRCSRSCASPAARRPRAGTNQPVTRCCFASGCATSTRRRGWRRAVDYLGLRFTGRAAATRASMLASWITDNRIGAPFGYVDSLLVRTRRERSKLRSSCHRERARAAASRGGRGTRGRGRRARRVRIPDLHAAVVGSGASPPTTPTSPSPPPPGSAPAFPSNAPTSCTRSPPFRGSTLRIPSSSQPGDRRRGAPLAARADRHPDDGLLGGGSGIGAEGAAAEGLAPSFDDLIRLPGRPQPGARACCSCPGSTESAVRRRTRPCAPAG